MILERLRPILVRLGECDVMDLSFAPLALGLWKQVRIELSAREA